MFIPPEFQEHDRDLIHGLVEEIRLGSLLTVDPRASHAGVVGSHIPFLLDRSRGPNGTLIGHVDRRNMQWRVLEQGDEALVTFLGPDANVSAGWYGSKPRVPTWLYVSIHAYGRAVMVKDAEGLRDMVVRLSEVMEPEGTPWAPSQVDAYIDRLVNGIVGFEIEITHIECQIRLGQNNSKEDIRRVHDMLAVGTSRQTRVAEMMRRLVVLSD